MSGDLLPRIRFDFSYQLPQQSNQKKRRVLSGISLVDGNNFCRKELRVKVEFHTAIFISVTVKLRFDLCEPAPWLLLLYIAFRWAALRHCGCASLARSYVDVGKGAVAWEWGVMTRIHLNVTSGIVEVLIVCFLYDIRSCSSHAVRNVHRNIRR